MSSRKVVVFYKEYNRKENTAVNLENCIVAHTVERNIQNAHISYVIDALTIIAEIEQLKLSRKDGFAKARKILIKSVINN
jgi:hypothetical protein